MTFSSAPATYCWASRRSYGSDVGPVIGLKGQPACAEGAGPAKHELALRPAGKRTLRAGCRLRIVCELVTTGDGPRMAATFVGMRRLAGSDLYELTVCAL